MRANCKKIALLVGGLAIFGMAGFSVCCFAQNVQVQTPIQRVCESPFGPASPLFEDVKQIYLLWHFNAEQPELLSESLREEALKKEVLAYMQIYLTPCSKSKEIKIMDWDDNSVMADRGNLISYVFVGQTGERVRDKDGKSKVNYSNELAIRPGFYRAGSAMSPSDLFANSRNLWMVSGSELDVKQKIHNILSSGLSVKGTPHSVIE